MSIVNPAWSPNGERIAVIVDHNAKKGVYVFPAHSRGFSKGDWAIILDSKFFLSNLKWSATSTMLSVEVQEYPRPNVLDRKVFAIDLRENVRYCLSERGSHTFDFGSAWSPKGNKLAFLSDTPISGWDGYSSTPKGIGRYMKRITYHHYETAKGFAPSSTPKNLIRVVNFDATEQNQGDLTLSMHEVPISNEGGFDWSPDGEHLVVVSKEREEQPKECIYLLSLNQDKLSRVR
jgi:hypothetical protein